MDLHKYFLSLTPIQAKEYTKFMDILGENLKYVSSQRQGGVHLAKSRAFGEKNWLKTRLILQRKVDKNSKNYPVKKSAEKTLITLGG